jgi:hypothetical protein
MDALHGEGPVKPSWLTGFVIASAAAVGAVVLGLWLANAMPGAELGHHAMIALTLGILFSTALGIALMALIFYSNRSKQDEVAHDAGLGSPVKSGRIDPP